MIPLSLPILFAVGSTLANTVAQRQRDKATSAAMTQERTRQRQFDEEQMAAANAAKNQYEGAPANVEKRSDTLAEMFRSQDPAASAVPQVQMPDSGNVVVANRGAAADAQASSFVDDRAENLADFRSFGDLFGDLGTGTARAGQEIGMLNSLRRGSRSILPMELEGAQQKGKGMNMLGDLMSLGYSATINPALTGKSIWGR